MLEVYRPAFVPDLATRLEERWWPDVHAIDLIPGDEMLLRDDLRIFHEVVDYVPDLCWQVQEAEWLSPKIGQSQ